MQLISQSQRAFKQLARRSRRRKRRKERKRKSRHLGPHEWSAIESIDMNSGAYEVSKRLLPGIKMLNDIIYLQLAKQSCYLI